MAGLVLLSAGGTGGHLFPAEALGSTLAGRGWRVHLATDHRVEAYGRDFPAEEVHVISSATLSKSPVEFARAAFRLYRGVMSARALIKKIRPTAAVGFGGYPTVPPMLAASRAQVPTVIHEANAVIGRANRFLAPLVSAIATSVERVNGAEKFLAKTVETGNPVRPAVLAAADMPYPLREAGAPFKLLVFGGSQGAKFLSDLAPPAVSRLPTELRSRLRIVQQCRPEDLERVGAAYRAAGVSTELAPFFRDLPARIAESHLVLSRAGASTIAELAVIGRPAIMVPLPHALDQDQKANAEVLARAGGGWMIEQREMSPERLAGDLVELITEPVRLEAAAAGARTMGRPDAVERLADLVERVAAGMPINQGVAA